jgi:sulfide:quinone oxidoreductase
MNLKRLSPTVYASGQITAADLRSLGEYGIRSIINNRPDHESPGQPMSADLEKTAAELGMQFVHIPVSLNAITETDIVEMRKACSALDAPILLFCRSGTRSTVLWNLTMQLQGRQT